MRGLVRVPRILYANSIFSCFPLYSNQIHGKLTPQSPYGLFLLCQHSAGGLMTYKEFKYQLRKELKERFPSGTSITIQQISHNNDQTEEALTILEPGLNISPTIYLGAYFQQLEKQIPMSSIITQIYNYYLEHRSLHSIDTSFFTCFDNIRPRIVYKLVHQEKNKELLKEVPWIPYLDLAIVFYCLLSKSPTENASVLIRNEHLCYWNVSVGDLLSLAQKNTPFLLSSCCDSLTELLLPVLKQLPARKETENDFASASMVPMYVLTNQQRFLGACCILYDDVLKEIAERLDCDLYILPSSIHEVILMPATVTESALSLSQMVCDINRSEVSPEEILSDHIYYYHRTTDSITM